MKNITILTLLICATIFSSNLQAQTDSDEAGIKAFDEKFMSAYNQEDVDAIQKLYLDDAVRVDRFGQELKGADKIANFFRMEFMSNDATLTMKKMNINWSDYQHAFVSSGTYEIKGIQHVYDLKIHTTLKYENTMIKENGTWKIARSVLTAND